MFKRIDLTGQSFGEWIVLSIAGDNNSGARCYKCKCTCGAIKTLVGSRLASGRTHRCKKCAGKLHSIRMHKCARNSSDIIGHRFGKWLVLDNGERGKDGLLRVICKCDCGTISLLNKYNLTDGKSSQCTKCRMIITHAASAKADRTFAKLGTHRKRREIALSKNRYYGVSLERGRFRATIKDINLGMFDTMLEAGLAYDQAAREIHGEHAIVNFPDVEEDTE